MINLRHYLASYFLPLTSLTPPLPDYRLRSAQRPTSTKEAQ